MGEGEKVFKSFCSWYWVFLFRLLFNQEDLWVRGPIIYLSIEQFFSCVHRSTIFQWLSVDQKQLELAPQYTMFRNNHQTKSSSPLKQRSLICVYISYVLALGIKKNYFYRTSTYEIDLRKWQETQLWHDFQKFCKFIMDSTPFIASGLWVWNTVKSKQFFLRLIFQKKVYVLRTLHNHQPNNLFHVLIPAYWLLRIYRPFYTICNLQNSNLVWIIVFLKVWANWKMSKLKRHVS